jgi:hypothetical protein
MQVADSRIDWFQIVVDLGRAGLPTRSVAGQIGVPKATILGWKQGAEPKHADGERLLELWCRMTGRGREHLPRVASSAWWSSHWKPQ